MLVLNLGHSFCIGTLASACILSYKNNLFINYYIHLAHK